MGELFLKLLNMSFMAGILVIAVLVLRLLFKKAPKALVVVMWALVGIRLVCPITLESEFSLLPDTQPVLQEIIEWQDATVGITQEKMETDSPVFDEPEYLDAVKPEADVVAETPIPDNSGEDVRYEEIIEGSTIQGSREEGNFENSAAEKQNDNKVLQQVLSVASVVWFVGMLAMFVYSMISYLRIYRKVRESAPLLRDKYVRICDGMDTPFILGIFKPRIYLPSTVTEPDLGYVLAHERAHLKRLDHVWKPIGFVLLSVYWFNPMLWIAYVLLCRDIELACDEKVLKELGVECKKSYSTALINCSVSRKMVAACPLAFGEVGVKGRIKSILNYKKPAFGLILVAVAACIWLAVSFLTNPKGTVTMKGASTSGPDIEDIAATLPERYDYEEVKAVFLEYLNHQAWLYPDEYSQETYEYTYEVYHTADSYAKRVYLKMMYHDKEHWVKIEPEQYFLEDTPLRVHVQKNEFMNASKESGGFFYLGTDSITVPAPTKPEYEEQAESIASIQGTVESIYSDLKQNGYGEDLKLEVWLSAFDIEKKLYPYVYIIINEITVFETSFTDTEGLGRKFWELNYSEDRTVEYSTGFPEVFDGRSIKPLDSVDFEQLERVKACAALHYVYQPDTTQKLTIAGETVSVPKQNVTINEELGVGIAFVHQYTFSHTAHYNIYRSEDNGKSWFLVAEDYTATFGDIASVLIPERNTVVCYFALSGVTVQSGYEVSKDGGATWGALVQLSKPNDYLKDPEIGFSVLLGSYEQDGNLANGKEELEWFVLDKRDGKALLLSKYGLETMPYHDAEVDAEVTWETCSLRSWLNEEFYKTAFTTTERTRIVETLNENPDNSYNGTEGGNTTKDFVFLLSMEEVLYGKREDEKPYFRDDAARVTVPTAYAAVQGAWLDENGEWLGENATWWLRTPGGTGYRAVKVEREGSISVVGTDNEATNVVVRPAIWIDLNLVEQ